MSRARTSEALCWLIAASCLCAAQAHAAEGDSVFDALNLVIPVVVGLVMLVVLVLIVRGAIKASMARTVLRIRKGDLPPELVHRLQSGEELPEEFLEQLAVGDGEMRTIVSNLSVEVRTRETGLPADDPDLQQKMRYVMDEVVMPRLDNINRVCPQCGQEKSEFVVGLRSLDSPEIMDIACSDCAGEGDVAAAPEEEWEEEPAEEEQTPGVEEEPDQEDEDDDWDSTAGGWT